MGGFFSKTEEQREAISAPKNQKLDDGSTEGKISLEAKTEVVVGVQKQQQAEWEQYDVGGELETILSRPSIALIDAHWLIERAKLKQPLVRRQELPDAAFVSLDELKQFGFVRKGIPLIAISHMWLARGHPDPLGHNLAILGKVLEGFCYQEPSPSATVVGPAVEEHNLKSTQRWAIFFDFLSMHQRPREKEEEDLFKEGLGTMSTFYAHMFTRVFRFTKLPLDYPKGYTVRQEKGKLEYMMRGWCFTETEWTRLSKSGRKCLDIGRFTGQYTKYLDIVAECVPAKERTPPMLPDDFNKVLDSKIFTYSDEDKPIVCELYRTQLLKRFTLATILIYHNLGWEDEDVRILVETLRYVTKEKGPLHITSLSLNGNHITDAGASILEGLLREGALPQLATLDLSDNRISDASKARIEDATPKRPSVDVDPKPSC